jgi:hypothetical protein
MRGNQCVRGDRKAAFLDACDDKCHDFLADALEALRLSHMFCPQASGHFLDIARAIIFAAWELIAKLALVYRAVERGAARSGNRSICV